MTFLRQLVQPQAFHGLPGGGLLPVVPQHHQHLALFGVGAGSAVECMKSPCRGRNGHIAIATGDLEGASALLRRRGVA